MTPKPCPFCGGEMMVHEHCFVHPKVGNCVLKGYSFGSDKVGQWNTREDNAFIKRAAARLFADEGSVW